ncbi:hypothetical protein [Tenacibaculum singaporense]|uniref:hypothetical protein n=1 Tax=Tenacibaculum singaporense TaxID=2358479 RepID=UPI000F680354|nr:hypothetical protein [Tenacibaculum singaporense]RSC96020.1 hypothetical protein EI424_02565 [Tenacibaculum singaporense]
MKKLLFAFVLISTTCFSQEFTYKKVISQGHTLKMKGKISVSDSIISIYTNDMPAIFKVEKTLEANFVKQYKALQVSADTEIRITLSNPEKPSKLNPRSLLMETKNSFSNDIVTLLYLLD